MADGPQDYPRLMRGCYHDIVKPLIFFGMKPVRSRKALERKPLFFRIFSEDPKENFRNFQ